MIAKWVDNVHKHSHNAASWAPCWTGSCHTPSATTSVWFMLCSPFSRSKDLYSKWSISPKITWYFKTNVPHKWESKTKNNQAFPQQSSIPQGCSPGAGTLGSRNSGRYCGLVMVVSKGEMELAQRNWEQWMQSFQTWMAPPVPQIHSRGSMPVRST